MQDHVIKIVKTKNTDKCMILIGFIISVHACLLVYLEVVQDEIIAFIVH